MTHYHNLALMQTSLSAAGIFVVLLAFTLANLPFLNQRLFGILPVPGLRKGVRKSLGGRCVELAILYVVTGMVSRALEARVSAVFAQTWPFYVITFCLFLVCAAPGFTVCYLWKRCYLK